MPNKKKKNFTRGSKDVHQEELKALQLRRHAAGLQASISAGSNGTPSGDDNLRNRTGLALSGGGVRSASFNLGVVQSFYQNGLLRQFDYLSTVSGGGYLAALIASMACLRPDAPATHQDGECRDGGLPIGQGNGQANVASKSGAERERREKCSDLRLDLTQADPNEDGDCLRPKPSGQQPREVRRLIRCGRYLFRPLEAGNRFAFGIVGINLMILCGLASLAALAAFLFRIWDDQEILVLDDFPQAFGFSGDVRRAFFWTAILGVAWLVIWSGKQKTWSLNSDSSGGLNWITEERRIQATHAAKWIFVVTSIALAALLIGFGLAAWDVFVTWKPTVALLVLAAVLAGLYAWFEHATLRRILPGKAGAAESARQNDIQPEIREIPLSKKAIGIWLCGAVVSIVAFGMMGWLIGPTAKWSDIPQLKSASFWWGSAVGFESEPHRIRFWLLLGLALMWLTSGYFAAPPARKRSRAKSDHVLDRVHRMVFHGISYALLASVPMAIVCLLVTGDVSFNRPAQTAPQPDVSSAQHGLLAALIALQVIALFPLFKFGRLIESGVQNKSRASTAVFRIAAVGLIFGVPLFLFGVFVREDLSRTVKNVHETRPGVGLYDYHATQLLSASDINNWSTFWRSIISQSSNAEGKSIDPVAARLIEAAHQWDKSGRLVKTGEAVLLESIERHLDFQETNRSLHWWHHLWPPRAADVFVMDHQSLLANRTVIDRINRRVLSDPTFYEKVEKAVLLGLRAREHMQMNSRKEVTTQGPGLAAETTRSSELVTSYSTKMSSPLGSLPADADLKKLIPLISLAKGLERRFTAHVKRSLARVQSDDPFQWNMESNSEVEISVRLLREVQKTNSDLLRAYYGQVIRPERTVYAYIVHRSDQRTRLWYSFCFGIAFLVLAIVLNLNSLSLHHFYRDRLGHMWITGEHNDLKLSELADSTLCKDGSKPPRLQPAPGLPYLLINATAHLKVDQESHAGRASLSRRGPLVRFLLSPLYCGCRDTGYVPTRNFEEAQPEGFGLIDAVAISGGAVSPEMTESFLLRTLLYLANLRLGLRVVNPAYLGNSLAPPGDPAGCKSRFGQGLWWLRRRATPISRYFDSRKNAAASGAKDGACTEPPRHVLLSDGGFYENLGIEALLLRRTRVIVAVDASQDSQGNFADLFRLVRRCRTMFGIRIHTGDKQSIAEKEIKTLCRRSNSWPTQANYVVACISYPPEKGTVIRNPHVEDGAPYTEDLTFGEHDGILIYVKPVLTKDTDAALWGYSRENADFPNDPTVDQFYNERRFESYRQLGASIGEKVFQLIQGRAPDLQENKDSAWLARWPHGSVDFDRSNRDGGEDQHSPSPSSDSGGGGAMEIGLPDDIAAVQSSSAFAGKLGGEDPGPKPFQG